MRITDSARPIDAETSYSYTLVTPDGICSDTAGQVQTENSVRVFVNGEPTMTLMCSADHVVELVVGRMFTEGMICGTEEIDEISVCEYATRVLVYLHDRDADLSKSHVEEVSSCCTFNKTLNSHFFRDEKLKPVTPHRWSPQRIFELACAFESDTPVHKRTFGAHSCYLADEHDILYCYEDLGRHNAFDKVIGSALINGVDLSSCIVFTSGRIPTDMAVKAVRAGVPIIVSKAVPTDLTIEMARKYDLTLICSAHHDSMKVFNDPYGALNEHREARQAKIYLTQPARVHARDALS